MYIVHVLFSSSLVRKCLYTIYILLLHTFLVYIEHLKREILGTQYFAGDWCISISIVECTFYSSSVTDAYVCMQCRADIHTVHTYIHTYVHTYILYVHTLVTSELPSLICAYILTVCAVVVCVSCIKQTFLFPQSEQ